MHEFYMRFQDTLSSMIGEKVYLKLDKYERIESITLKIIVEKRIPSGYKETPHHISG